MIRFLSIWVIVFELSAAAAWADGPAARPEPGSTAGPATSTAVPAATAPPTVPLDNLLARTEHRVEQFWDQFSAVTCTETVEQEKLGDNGKVSIKKRSAYDYLVLLLLSGGDLTVQESRLLQGKPARESDRALLSTSGFSTMVLIFHPHFRESFTFADEGADPQSPSLGRVHFDHIHGKTSPSVLQLRSRDYPIEWQGTAWIDIATGNIARIQAALKTSLADIGLQKLESEVRYSPVVFAGHADPPWMPATASIEADTVHQHWRNVHAFTAYKQFSVSTDSKTEVPRETPKQ